MATSTIGTMQEFQPGSEPITAYLERLKAFLDANEIADDKRASVLISTIGHKTYAVLRSLMAPATPQTKAFDVLEQALKKHYEPKPLIIAERYIFNQRNQFAGESVAEYVAELRRLASTCSFGEFLDDALRDRIVCGLRNESARRRLLAEADGNTTLARVTQMAQSHEQAEKNAKALKGPDAAIKKLSATPRRGNSDTPSQRKPCYRCGRTNHDSKDCRFVDSTCHYCKKKGHIAPACSKKKGNSRKNTKHIAPVSDDSDAEEFHLHTIGSRSSRPLMVTLHIEDKPLPMELDTGAAFSVISEATYKATYANLKLRKSNVLLKTYTDERIPVIGQLNVHVRYGEQSASLVLLVVAGDGPTLLGRNWLRYIRLDWKSINAVSAQPPSIAHLQTQHEALFTDELGKIKQYKAKLQVCPEAPPRFYKSRPVPFAIKAAIEEELDRLEASGVIQKVTHSDWAAPIVPVPKKNGRFRICGDYKVTVNQVLDVDQYPLPKPEELFATLAGGKKFTKLDLSQAYKQLPLDDESMKYVTINTHRGLYCYTRLPFGVASAPALFQKLMDSVLQGIPHVICYIDDILVTGSSDEEHLRNLATVFKRLQEFGFRLKKEKCAFLRDSVEFLGHKIDAEGLHAMPEKIEAIVSAPEPRDLQELRSFLGLLNYYGKFLPNLSTLVHPLNSLLQPSKKWKWSTECAQAFRQAKEALSSASVLVHYDPTLPLTLAGDASAYGIGAVISHVLPDGSEKPIAFASRTLTPSERNYAQIEKEGLSLIFGVKKFHQYLYGRKFLLVTDHKPLLAILGPKKGIPSLAAARLQRWAVLLSAYQYEIKFKSTTEHANADGLSRLPLPANTDKTTISTKTTSVFNISQALPITSSAIGSATMKDAVLSKVYFYTQNTWPDQVEEVLKPYLSRQHQLTVEGDCLMWGIRVVVPHKHREYILQELHRDHPGCSRMKSIARSFVWWPGLDKDIERIAKSCTACQQNKHAPSPAPLHPWTWPTKPWQRIHLDFAGPFLGTSFLVIVDAHSKWPEVFQMSTTTASKTIVTLRHLFATYGLPEQIVSDNGPQFTSDEFECFMKSNGVKHIRCAPYHPSSNGAVERFNQTFKQALRASEKDGRTLSHGLADFLLTYRSTPHATTNRTPSSLFLQRELRTRFTLIHPDVSKHVHQKQAEQISQHDQHTKSRNFPVGQNVMVRQFRAGPKWIPGTILKQTGPLSYIVKVHNGLEWKRHVDHLRANVNKEPLNSESQPSANYSELDSDDFPLPSTDENSSDVSSGSEITVSSDNASTSIPEVETSPRYPTRIRNEPDRYM